MYIQKSRNRNYAVPAHKVCFGATPSVCLKQLTDSLCIYAFE